MHSVSALSLLHCCALDIDLYLYGVDIDPAPCVKSRNSGLQGHCGVVIKPQSIDFQQYSCRPWLETVSSSYYVYIS